MPDNPFTSSRWYVSARERFGWRLGVAGFVYGTVCTLITLASVAGNYQIASTSRIIPMVVQVDRSTGEIVSTYKVDHRTPVDSRMIHATLANWIGSARLVTADVQLQREAVFRVYACLSTEDPAYVKMNDWLNGSPESSPFKRSQEVTVSTEILSCIQQSDSTWQVDWLEKTYDRKGSQLREDRMRALATVDVSDHGSSATEDDIRRNPLGIFIRDINWARQSQ